MVSAKSLKSFLFAPATDKPTGTPSLQPGASVWCLSWPDPWGSRPVFFPRQRRLSHRPIHGKPAPVDAIEGVVLRQACLPEAQEKPVLDPLLETIMRRGAWANARGRERVPLAARSQHEKDAVRTLTIRHARAASAKAVGVFV